MRSLVVSLLLVAGAAPAFAGSVTGTVRYEDRAFNRNGFTGVTRWVPVRHALVEIIGAESGNSLGWAWTGQTGAYSAALTGEGVKQVYLRVWAYSNPAKARVGVRNAEGLYAVGSSAVLVDCAVGGTISLDVSVGGGFAGVFNIYDVAVRSQEFLVALEAPQTVSLVYLTLYFQSGENDNATYLHGSRRIVLGGTASNRDDFDDDTILHECGHYVTFNYSLDHNPGASHAVSGQYDPRLTWSEGLASFWSGAVREWVNTQTPGFYTDNEYYVTFWYDRAAVINREAPPSYAVYAENETAVQAALWDVYDPANEGVSDLVAQGIVPLWGALRHDIPLMDGMITVEDCFDALAARNPGSVEALQMVFAGRAIRYLADGFESAEYVPVAYRSETSLRTFYPRNDLDWFNVSLVQGDRLVLSVSHAKDAASPLFAVYDASGNAVAVEASSIDTTVAVAGTYRVSVRQTTDASRLGDYGQYRFWVDDHAHAPDAAPAVQDGYSGNASQAGSGGGGGGGGGGCGSIGFDLMLVPFFIGLMRRLTARRRA